MKFRNHPNDFFFFCFLVVVVVVVCLFFVCCLFVLFCFVLFCFVLFCFVCFVLFCSVLFCSGLFCFLGAFTVLNFCEFSLSQLPFIFILFFCSFQVLTQTAVENPFSWYAATVTNIKGEVMSKWRRKNKFEKKKSCANINGEGM